MQIKSTENKTIPMPEQFLLRMKDQLKEQFQAYIDAMAQEPVRGIRMNQLKKADFLPENLGEIPWWQGGFYISADSAVGSYPLHDAGAYYIQEPSAMLPVEVLDPKPGERVLDLCAAPGGKSTQIGERLKGKGLLVANEPVPKRAQILSRNIERMGITNSVVTCAYPAQLSAKWEEQFDAILVDAPCSGEGMFRKNPESRLEWTEENAAGCAVRQLDILGEAAKMLKPGGRIVYSTCTLNPEENERNIFRFMDNHKEFALQQFQVPQIDAKEGFFTCMPQNMHGEGHFAALLVKSGSDECRQNGCMHLMEPAKQMMAAFRDFPDNSLIPNAVFKDTLVHINENIDLTGITTLRVGLHMGTVRGKIFIPDHSWAVSACPPNLPRVQLTENEAVRYQTGETIECSSQISGWALAVFDSMPLGSGKVSGGIMKNHYPKGLRK